MGRGHAVFLLASLPVLAMSTGCSLLFATPVHTNGAVKTSDGCSESRVAPVVDTLAWMVAGFRAGDALVSPDSAYQGQTLSREANLALGTSAMVLFAASSAYGFRSAEECGKVRAVEEAEPPRARRLRPRDLAPSPTPAPLSPPVAYEPPSDGQSADAGVTPAATLSADGGAAGAVVPRPAPPAIVPRPAPPAGPQPVPQAVPRPAGAE